MKKELYSSREVIETLKSEGMSYTSIAIAIGRARSTIMGIVAGTSSGERCQVDLNRLFVLSEKKTQYWR